MPKRLVAKCEICGHINETIRRSSDNPFGTYKDLSTLRQQAEEGTGARYAGHDHASTHSVKSVQKL